MLTWYVSSPEDCFLRLMHRSQWGSLELIHLFAKVYGITSTKPTPTSIRYFILVVGSWTGRSRSYSSLVVRYLILEALRHWVVTGLVG